MSESFQNRTNNHHLLFSRAQHDAIEPTRLLRANPGMQATIDVDSHNEIHRELNIVPALDFHNACRVLSALRKRPLNPYDPIHSMDNFMLAVQEALKFHKNKTLDKALGALVIDAMEIQRPIIKQGLSRKKIIDLGRFANHKRIGTEEVA